MLCALRPDTIRLFRAFRLFTTALAQATSVLDQVLTRVVTWQPPAPSPSANDHLQVTVDPARATTPPDMDDVARFQLLFTPPTPRSLSWTNSSPNAHGDLDKSVIDGSRPRSQAVAFSSSSSSTAAVSESTPPSKSPDLMKSDSY